MNYYINITLLPDAEFSQNILLGSLYTKLHKVLFDMDSTHIGVSFPRYACDLGAVLRIHGEENVLNDLQEKNWLGGMSGYCNVSLVLQIPNDVKYRTVSRVQTTMSQAKLRRLIKRGAMSDNDISQYQRKMFTKGLNNPYAELVSGSNKQKYRRYIEFGELLDKPVTGQFDHFGLSKIATIPWFS